MFYTDGFLILSGDTDVSFGSRTIVSRGTAMARDRLGSNRVGGVKYYPYGEEQGAGTANDRDKYGTYYRDATTGLDYTQNRYYASSMGRFVSPDPCVASVGAADPGNWNRYAYTRGDPINRMDPSGLDDCTGEYGTPYLTATTPIDPETNPGALPVVNGPDGPGLDWIVTIPSPTLPSTTAPPDGARPAANTWDVGKQPDTTESLYRDDLDRSE